MPLDEVVEIIELPNFDRRAARRQRENITDVELSPLVMTLLKDYISEVAAMYNDNPFHNVSRHWYALHDLLFSLYDSPGHLFLPACIYSLHMRPML